MAVWRIKRGNVCKALSTGPAIVLSETLIIIVLIIAQTISSV